MAMDTGCCATPDIIACTLSVDTSLYPVTRRWASPTVQHDGIVVSIFNYRRSARLQRELVHTNEGDSVSARNVSDLLGSTPHDQHCSLNALGIEVFFASWPVVRALDRQPSVLWRHCH